MKIFKKIVVIFLLILILSGIGGYVYFNKKFTPPENYLTVSGNAKKIPLLWISDGDTPYAAVLLPIKIKGVDYPLYMQLDFGSPVTVFYSHSLQSIITNFPHFSPLKNIDHRTANLNMNVGDMIISSHDFQLLDYGSKVNYQDPDAKNIIGTIGTDLLEKRIIVLDFPNNYCSFVDSVSEIDFNDFEFKKRKILLPTKIDQKNLKVMYDSGTSAYELITNKENWEKYKTKNSILKKEKGNSWGATLDIISAKANKEIQFSNTRLRLQEVTYIEGTSGVQNLLMKFSGMQGMVGNKLFLHHKVILDCKNEKFKIQ
ncbi:hypothetical protein CEY12_18280 [Chryseobacterium sp. T16E-39]|uniref:hypothetical protein n=1 Tax=Chryseobacterium sp. T16E-39 TaxID=2015076 RepID=UPI000B5B1B89|nr:hypothetical protein [Chryseobacterium sp. T16E-39]ASK31936.1 hypothetical protein CEY12_18280 [Chryseobacterium sp. T16E-39]